MFRFFGDEDDDVSAVVILFVQEYIGILKQMKQIFFKYREYIEVQIVYIRGCGVKKMLILNIYVNVIYIQYMYIMYLIIY